MTTWRWPTYRAETCCCIRTVTTGWNIVVFDCICNTQTFLVFGHFVSQVRGISPQCSALSILLHSLIFVRWDWATMIEVPASVESRKLHLEWQALVITGWHPCVWVCVSASRGDSGPTRGSLYESLSPEVSFQVSQSVQTLRHTNVAPLLWKEANV